MGGLALLADDDPALKRLLVLLSIDPSEAAPISALSSPLCDAALALVLSSDISRWLRLWLWLWLWLWL